MSLIANSAQARVLARHVILGATHLGTPVGWTVPTYRRRLRELARAGVIRPWEWTVDGQHFAPRCPVAGLLWLAGLRWGEYGEEARAKGLLGAGRILFDVHAGWEPDGGET